MFFRGWQGPKFEGLCSMYIIQIILAIYIPMSGLLKDVKANIWLMVNPTLPSIPSLIFTLIFAKFLENNFCLCIGCVHSDSGPIWAYLIAYLILPVSGGWDSSHLSQITGIVNDMNLQSLVGWLIIYFLTLLSHHPGEAWGFRAACSMRRSRCWGFTGSPVSPGRWGGITGKPHIWWENYYGFWSCHANKANPLIPRCGKTNGLPESSEHDLISVEKWWVFHDFPLRSVSSVSLPDGKSWI